MGKGISRNQGGWFHLHIAIPLVVVSALIGAWYVYMSYKEQRLKENMSRVLEDYRSAVVRMIPDQKDKEKVRQLFRQIEEVAGKYNDRK